MNQNEDTDLDGVEMDDLTPDEAAKARALEIRKSQDQDAKGNIKNANFATSAQFSAIQKELVNSSFYASLEDRDTDAWWTNTDYAMYKIENLIAADAVSSSRFVIYFSIHDGR